MGVYRPMTTLLVLGAQRERISSRAAEHRLDESHQVIPQHGCIPAVPASVSPGEVIVAAPDANVEDAACCRRSCRWLRASSNLRSRAAWISACRPASLSCGVT